MSDLNRLDKAQLIERLKDCQQRLQAVTTPSAHAALAEQLFGDLPAGLLILDEQGRIREVNPTAERLLGLSTAELHNREIRELYPPEQQGLIDSHLHAVFTSAETQQTELDRKHGAGPDTRLLLRSAIMRGTQPHLCCVLLLDISARRQTDETLRIFSRVIEQTESTVVITNPKGVIEYVNPRFTETTGYTPEEAIGRRPSILKSGYTSDDEYRDLWHTIKAGHVWHGEFHNRRKDGSLFWESAIISPVRNERGELTHFAGIKDDITERKRIERALRDSKEQLKLFIQHAPAALAMFDRDMRYLAVSRRWLDDYFLGDRDVIGHSHYEIFPEIPEHWKAVHRRGMQNEIIRNDEDRFERLDGSVQWLRWEVRPWHMADGKVGGIVIFTEDITERKQAQSTLAESEEQNRAVIETAAEGIWMLDEQGRILAVNAAYVRRSGYSRDELLGMSIPDLDVYEPPEIAHQHIEKVKRMGNDLFETRHRTKSGEIWPVEVSASFWPAAGGRYIAFLRDISERKQAEEALRESENRYRNLFMHAPDCILVNQNDRITMVNRACLQMFGAEHEDDLLGKPSTDLIHSDFHPVMTERIRHMMEKQEPVPPLEEQIVRLDGQAMDVEVVAAPFPLGDGSGIHVILRDISDRKMLERQIIDVSTAEQERIGRDIHDGIGQQLTGMTMLAAGIERRLRSAGHDTEAEVVADLQQHLQSALREARTLARGLSPVEIDPEGLTEALDDLALQIRTGSGVTCRFQGTEGIRVHDGAMAVHLFRIAQEAVNNALKHANPKQILITLERADGDLALSIRDDGIGIDLKQDRQEHLGLHTMKYRANIIGGEFSVRPLDGGGTLVRCTVPMTGDARQP